MLFRDLRLSRHAKAGSRATRSSRSWPHAHCASIQRWSRRRCSPSFWRARRAPSAWADYLTHPQTLDYAWRVALGWEVVYRSPGAFPANRSPTMSMDRCGRCRSNWRLYAALLVAGIGRVVGATRLVARRLVRVDGAVHAAAGLVSAGAQRRRRARAGAAVRVRFAGDMFGATPFPSRGRCGNRGAARRMEPRRVATRGADCAAAPPVS